MTGAGGFLRSTRTVAGLSWRLARREPSALAVAVVGAAIVAGLFLGLGLVTARTNERAEGRSFAVAVDDGQQGAAGFLEALDADDRFVVERFGDAADAVIDGDAAIGVEVPADIDRQLADGQDVTIRVLVRERQDVSLDAFGQVWDAVNQIRENALLANGGIESPLVVDRIEVSEDERANQIRLGQAVAAMVCFLCVRLVGSTAGVLGRAGDGRANEVLLLLPLDRRALTAGIAAGTTPLHAVHLLLAVAIVLGAATLPLATLGLSVGTVAAMVPATVAGTLLLGMLAAAAGVVAGSLGTGGDDTVSVGDLLALPFVAVAVILLLVTADAASPLAAFAIPVLGQALVVRDGVVGTLSAAELGVALLSTAAAVVVAATAAARVVGRERKVVRVSW